MLKHRLLTVSLVFLFSLGGLLNVFAHCVLENDLPIKTNGPIPASISCLHNQGYVFLAQVGQREKTINFLKIEKRAVYIYDKALLPEETFHLTILRSPASFLASVPVYQLKNVYRI